VGSKVHTLTRCWIRRKENVSLHVQSNLLIENTDGKIFIALRNTVWTVRYACFILSFRVGDLIAHCKTKVVLYRLFHEKRPLCLDVIISIIVGTKIHINISNSEWLPR
jgi:hypothetical protein